jgi:hypothetical protein
MDFYFLQQEKIDNMRKPQRDYIEHLRRRYEEENSRLMLKMRDMRDDILWYKERNKEGKEGIMKTEMRPHCEEQRLTYAQVAAKKPHKVSIISCTQISTALVWLWPNT